MKRSGTKFFKICEKNKDTSLAPMASSFQCRMTQWTHTMKVKTLLFKANEQSSQQILRWVTIVFPYYYHHFWWVYRGCVWFGTTLPCLNSRLVSEFPICDSNILDKLSHITSSYLIVIAFSGNFECKKNVFKNATYTQSFGQCFVFFHTTRKQARNWLEGKTVNVISEKKFWTGEGLCFAKTNQCAGA